MIRLFLVAAAVAVVVALVLRGYRFRLVFRHGKLVASRGRIEGALRRAFADVAQHRSISGRVTLWGERRLRFSGSIDDSDRQRFRNVFFSTR